MRIAVSRSPNAERVVTPLELFYDLVYAFAIGQLSHHLLEHIDLQTGAETVILGSRSSPPDMTAWGGELAGAGPAAGAAATCRADVCQSSYVCCDC
jgi:hypothetical protein